MRGFSLVLCFWLVAGKRNTLSFGTYPDVPVALARDRREEARGQIAAGIDPSAQRKDYERRARCKQFRGGGPRVAGDKGT